MLYQLYQQHIFPYLLNQVMQTPSLMDLRRELLLNISGEVLEIGFGTGLNLPFYQEVDLVYAVEPNPAIFKLAEPHIQQAAFQVEYIQASAEALPFAEHSLEHVVSGHCVVLLTSAKVCVRFIGCYNRAVTCMWSNMC